MYKETYVSRIPKELVDEVVVNDFYAGMVDGLVSRGQSIYDWLLMRSCLVVPRGINPDKKNLSVVDQFTLPKTDVYPVIGVGSHMRSARVGEFFTEINGIPRLPITVKGLGATGNGYMKAKRDLFLKSRQDPLGFFGDQHAIREMDYSNHGISLGWPVAGVIGYVVLKEAETRRFLAEKWKGTGSFATQVDEQINIVRGNRTNGVNNDKLALIFRHYATLARTRDGFERTSGGLMEIFRLFEEWKKLGSNVVSLSEMFDSDSFLINFMNYRRYYYEKFYDRSKSPIYSMSILDTDLGGLFTDFENCDPLSNKERVNEFFSVDRLNMWADRYVGDFDR